MTSYRAPSRLLDADQDNSAHLGGSSFVEPSRLSMRDPPMMSPNSVSSNLHHTSLGLATPRAALPLRVSVFRNGAGKGRRCILDRAESLDVNLATVAKKLGLYQYSNPVIYTDKGLPVTGIDELIEGETIYFEPNGLPFRLPPSTPQPLSSTVTSIQSTGSRRTRASSIDFDYQLKFILVGGMAVGKSCLLKRFTDNTFHSEHEATICVDFGSKILDIGGKPIKCQVWDTAGQEDFMSITRAYYREAAAAILVYDVTHTAGLQVVKRWLDRVQESTSNHDLTLCLVANKVDLKEQRLVSEEEGEDFARRHQMLYFETSAKSGENVHEVFRETAGRIMRKVEQGLIDVEDSSQGVRRGEVETVTQSMVDGEREEQQSSGISSKPVNLTSAGVSEGCCF